MASDDEAAKTIRDKETRKKVFLALAYMRRFVTVNEVANWIKTRWPGYESPSRGHVSNILSDMRKEDKTRHSDRLLETKMEKPRRYRLGAYSVKTTASADMLLRILNKADRNTLQLSAEDERQIKKEIGNKYSISIDTLDKRLDKAIKGKYLKREGGLLKPLDRLSNYEYEFLGALQQFDFGLADETEQPDSGEPESNSVAQQHSPRRAENKTQKTRRKGQ